MLRNVVFSIPTGFAIISGGGGGEGELFTMFKLCMCCCMAVGWLFFAVL